MRPTNLYICPLTMQRSSEKNIMGLIKSIMIHSAFRWESIEESWWLDTPTCEPFDMDLELAW